MQSLSSLLNESLRNREYFKKYIDAELKQNGKIINIGDSENWILFEEGRLYLSSNDIKKMIGQFGTAAFKMKSKTNENGFKDKFLEITSSDSNVLKAIIIYCSHEGYRLTEKTTSPDLYNAWVEYTSR